MSHFYPINDAADDAGDAWSGDLRENVALEAEREALRGAMANPARVPAMVPLGRVLAVACLVPILAMIVLGASRIGLPAIEISAPNQADEGAAEAGDTTMLGSFDTAAAADLLAGTSRVETFVGPGATLYVIDHTEMMDVTAYCPCAKCCGKNARGITASGKPITHNGGRFVAADTRLFPFGSTLSIPGYHDDMVVEVIDRGGAIKGDKIDIFFPTHAQAREWGRQKLPVRIMRPLESADATPPADPLP